MEKIYIILRRPGVASFADIIKTAFTLIERPLKFQ